jgi:hypothetical protein
MPRRLHRGDHDRGGFSTDTTVELVNAGLATAQAERMVAGAKRIEVARVRITEAGRRALVEARR